jgi:hypothetical protein
MLGVYYNLEIPSRNGRTVSNQVRKEGVRTGSRKLQEEGTWEQWSMSETRDRFSSTSHYRFLPTQEYGVTSLPAYSFCLGIME